MGILTRRFDPSPSREVAIWALDRLIRELDEAISIALETIEKLLMDVSFHKRWHVMQCEDPYAFPSQHSQPKIRSVSHGKENTRKIHFLLGVL